MPPKTEKPKPAASDMGDKPADDEAEFLELKSFFYSVANSSLAELFKNKAKIGTKLKYDEKATLWRGLFAWRHTVMKRVFLRVDFYIFMAFFAIFKILNIYAVEDFPRLNLDVLSVFGTLTVFFLIFFNSQCYERYQKLIDVAMRAKASLTSVDLLLSGTSNDYPTSKIQMNRTVQIGRYLQAAHYLAYMHVCPTYRNGKAYSLTYEFLLRRAILNEEELVCIRTTEELDQNTVRMALTPVLWALRVLSEMERVGHIPKGPFTQGVRNQIVTFYQAMETIYDFREAYIPFPYFHLQNLVATVYLMARAFSDATHTDETADDVVQETIYTTLSYAALVFCICGLRSISQAMIYPLGDDPEDLPGALFWALSSQNHYHIRCDSFDPLFQKPCISQKSLPKQKARDTVVTLKGNNKVVPTEALDVPLTQ